MAGETSAILYHRAYLLPSLGRPQHTELPEEACSRLILLVFLSLTRVALPWRELTRRPANLKADLAKASVTLLSLYGFDVQGPRSLPQEKHGVGMGVLPFASILSKHLRCQQLRGQFQKQCVIPTECYQPLQCARACYPLQTVTHPTQLYARLTVGQAKSNHSHPSVVVSPVH